MKTSILKPVVEKFRPSAPVPTLHLNNPDYNYENTVVDRAVDFTREFLEVKKKLELLSVEKETKKGKLIGAASSGAKSTSKIIPVVGAVVAEGLGYLSSKTYQAEAVRKLRLLENGASNTDNLTKQVIRSAVELFISFEVPCNTVGTQNLRLAMDAVHRLFDYLDSECCKLQGRDPNLILTGVLFGKSKKDGISGRAVFKAGYGIGEYNTREIFEDCGVITNIEDVVVQPVKEAYGYRLRFKFEQGPALKPESVLNETKLPKIRNWNGHEDLIEKLCKRVEELIFPDFTRQLAISHHNEVTTKLDQIINRGKLENHRHIVQQEASENKKPIRFHVESLSQRFTGRHEELKKLHQILTFDNKIEGHQARIAVISGFGGIGKSTLARAYALEQKSFYKNVAWINAETRETMLRSFTELSEHLNIEMNHKTTGKGVEFITDKIYSYIGAAKSLLIFDNAEELKGVNGIQAFFPKSFTIDMELPHILVTTRRRDLIVDVDVKTLGLDVLNEKEALEFMLKWIKLETDQSQIIKLVQVLHMHPLAMEQAGAYIARQEILSGNRKNTISPVTQYVLEYETNAERLLNNKSFQELSLSTYESTTFVTVTSSLDKIHGESYGTASISLIEIISYLGSKNIPVNLFMRPNNQDWMSVFTEETGISELSDAKLTKKPRKGIWKLVCGGRKKQDILEKDVFSKSVSKSEERSHRYNITVDSVSQGLDLLKSYSLIQELESGISIHPLVQQIIQIVNSSSDKEIRILQSAVRLFSILFRKQEKFSLVEVNCIRHSTVILKNVLKHDSIIKEFPEFAPVVCRKLEFIRSHDETVSIIRLLEPKYKALFDSNSEYCIDLRRSYAFALSQKMMYDEALEIVNEYYPLAKEKLGHNHSLTLDLGNITGIILRRLNKHEAAFETFDEILPLYKLKQGETGIDVLTVLHNKAACLADLKKHKEAAEMYEYVYKLRREVIGEDHPNTLSTKFALAVELSTVKQLGSEPMDDNWDDIVRLFDDISSKHALALGEDHEIALVTGIGIIFAMLKKGGQGNNEKAEEMCIKLYEVQTKVFGTEHWVPVLTKHNYAVSLAQQGRTEEALPIFEEAQKIMAKVYAPTHQVPNRCAWWIAKIRDEQAEKTSIL